MRGCQGPVPSALRADRRGLEGPKPPGRSLPAVGSLIHGPHTGIIFSVLDVVGLPWLMLWGWWLSWPGEEGGVQVLGGSGRVRQGLCSLRGPDWWEEWGAGEARNLEKGAQDQASEGQVQNRRRPRADAQCRGTCGERVEQT